MRLELNNHRVFFIGLGVIIFFLFLNRFQFYWGSKIVVGTVIGFTKSTPMSRASYPEISFKADGIEYRVNGLKDLNVTFQDNVEMIYQPSDPTGAVVNSFNGFWMFPILYCLLPFMLWVSFVYAYITKKEALFVSVGKGEDDLENSERKFRFVSFTKGINSGNQ